MAKPVINTTQSVLGFLQWQAFEFQPYALNAATSWTASSLPPGVSINAVTGKISGMGTKAGVYVLSLRASNTDGTSDAVIFTIGIEASSPTAGSDIDVTIDLLTRKVSLTKAAPLAGAQDTADTSSTTAAATTEQAAAAAVPPIFRAKVGDDLIFRGRFVKGGAVVDPDITAFRFTLKELDPDSVLCSSDAFIRDGHGSDATFRIHAKLTGDDLTNALDSYEADAGTHFPALGEFEWEYNNPDTADFGPATLRGSTGTFRIDVARPQYPA